MEILVTSIDTFMSGWGKASDKQNLLIFECADREQAQIVYDNACNRSDQKSVKMWIKKHPEAYEPNNAPDYVWNDFYVQIKTIDDYPIWYKPNSF